jgi:hypothetical protein
MIICTFFRAGAAGLWSRLPVLRQQLLHEAAAAAAAALAAASPCRLQENCLQLLNFWHCLFSASS